MSDSASPSRRASAISGLLVVLALGILILGVPIIARYAKWFRMGHSPAAAALSVAASGVLLLLFVGFSKSTRVTVTIAGLVGLILVVTSGNAVAFLIALALLAVTLIAGDGVTRLLRGREARQGELSISVAAGASALGGSLLLLSDAGLARPLPLAALAILLAFGRWRRIPELGRLFREAARTVLDRRNSATESLWLTIVGVTIAASLLGALRPDVSFDGLAYHLPEIRDFARSGQVEPLGGIYETLLWRNHETYLGLAYTAGGEQAVQLLHFLVGLNLFGVIAALGRQLSRRDSSA